MPDVEQQVRAAACPPEAAPGPAPVGRWEWRTFTYRPQLWQDALREAAPTGLVALTSETYLLTPQSPCNVKLRDGRVEVKQLLRTDAFGLEQWRPVLKEGFPLAPAAVPPLYACWQRPCPSEVPELPTADHLLSFVARWTPDVRVIPVRKWRRPYLLRGCIAERATILVSGTLLETLALEHADPEVLHAALAALHLETEPNTNYVTELKRFF